MFDIVVSDDGSTDETIEVVSGYPNVRFVRGGTVWTGRRPKPRCGGGIRRDPGFRRQR